MSTKIKKILVTGAEGFIGSHLVELLLNKGYEINAFILYNFENRKGLLDEIKYKKNHKINFFYGDIKDLKTIEPAVKNCDCIINMAALIGIPYSYIASSSYVDVNIKGTLNLLNCAKQFKVKKFIHTSTSEVYGSAKFVPITEKHPLNAQSPYAATKIAADQLVNSYNKSFSLNTIIIRPFNTYGPRQSLRAVIPTIINQSLNNDKIKVGNINTKRDFTFVTDTANAFYKAILAGKKTNGKTINLGTGQEFTIKEIINYVSIILNKKIKIISDPKRIRPVKSEVIRLLSSNKIAKNYLKWIPKYKNRKGFIKGLKITIKYLKDKKNNRITDYIK